MQKIGKLIVIEGSDGSGKKTQVDSLKKRIEKEKISIFTIAFPRYNTPTRKVVRRYLEKEFGDSVDVNPYLASCLYATDRAASASIIRYYTNNGTNILCDRFIGSNLAHQGAKFTSLEEKDNFVKWDEQYEFGGLRIPKPDLTICLNLSVKHTKEAMDKQSRKKDGHESNLEYQQRVVDTYLWLAETKPDWVLVDCMVGDKRKTIEEITEEIWRIIEPVLVR